MLRGFRRSVAALLSGRDRRLQLSINHRRCRNRDGPSLAWLQERVSRPSDGGWPFARVVFRFRYSENALSAGNGANFHASQYYAASWINHVVPVKLFA